MPTVLTFLRPNNEYECFTSKTFKAGSPPVKTSDYKLGRHFDVKLVKVKNLREVHQALQKKADGWVRINGQPRSGLGLERVERNTENFPEHSSRLVMLDMDKWAVPADHIWDFRHPDSIHETVKTLLIQEGFDFLVDTDMVILLTSSQFGLSHISCHLYFMLDAPIAIVALREWTTALKQIKQRAVFDPATQRSVQPDYIGRRKCVGFVDPIPEEARLSFCEGLFSEIPLDELEARIKQDISLAGWEPGQGPTLRKIGANWLETLELCGAGEINEVAYRAAAQLVQEQGRDRVSKNLHKYAATMHATAWEAIKNNDPYSTGERDRKSDLETYTVARFQQYLTSALSKPFGANADALKQTVKDAITAAELGDLAALYEHPVTNAWFQLKGNHPGSYAELRAEFKRKLRSQVSVVEYEKAAKSVSRTPGESNTNVADTLEGDAAFIKRVLEEFDFIEDEFGVKYAGWNGGDSRYRLAPLDTELIWSFYAKGMVMSGGIVSPQFGKTAMQYLTGQDLLSKGGVLATFKKAKVGMRVYPEGGANSSGQATWINLGLQPSGQHICARVAPGEVSFVLDKESPVKWQIPATAESILIADAAAVATRFEDTEHLKDWTKRRLFDFFNVTNDDRSTFLGIIFALLSGRGTSPVIEFTGPPSSGKSTAADMLIDLIDPVKGIAGQGSGLSDMGAVKVDNLINVVAGRYLTAFDNVSTLTRPQQDALCQIATGASKDQRVLYMGTFVRIFAKRPVILTALSSVVTRPDLDSRKEEFQFSSRRGFNIRSRGLAEEWSNDKPFLFTGLLHLLSDALYIMETEDLHQDGVDVRRTWFSLADRLFYTPEEMRERQERRRFERSRTMMENSEFCLGLSAWLQSLEEPDGYGQIKGRSLDIYSAFQDWLTAKVGTAVKIRTPLGSIKWRVRMSYTNNGTSPATVQGFVWECSKQANVIADVTGWVISDQSVRGNTGSFRRWFRKPDEQLDTELEDL